MTRWHERDLSGHLLAMEDSSPMSDKWEVVRIPALNTTESLEKLEKARKKLVKQGYLSQNYTNLLSVPKFTSNLYVVPVDARLGDTATWRGSATTWTTPATASR